MTSKRQDTVKRYEEIKRSYGDFKDKTLIDMGCSDGYFLFKFVVDGGAKAMGVEINEDQINFINSLASAKRLPVYCVKELRTEKSDIGIYLDLYGHDEFSVSILNKMNEQCDTLFVSNSGSNGDGRHASLLKHLSDIGRHITVINETGFNGRLIVRADR